MPDTPQQAARRIADELVFPYGPPAEDNMHALAGAVAKAICEAEERGGAREREACAEVCRAVYAEHRKSKSYPADMGGLAKECEERIGARAAADGLKG